MNIRALTLIVAGIAAAIALGWSDSAGAVDMEVSAGIASYHVHTPGLNENNPGLSIGVRQRVSTGLSVSLSLGHVLANSFGKPSTYAAAGVGYRVGWIEAGVRVGGVTGYEGAIATPSAGGINLMAAPYLEAGTDTVGIRVNLFGEAIYPELVWRF